VWSLRDGDGTLLVALIAFPALGIGLVVFCHCALSRPRRVWPNAGRGCKSQRENA
jgi:hypothetical protein